MPFPRTGKPAGAKKMVKRPRTPLTAFGAPKEPAGRRPPAKIVHSSMYLPEPVYEALRETAFKERCKIHDLVMQGIDLALRKRGYPSVDELKVGRKR
jgi:hypothetical protein